MDDAGLTEGGFGRYGLIWGFGGVTRYNSHRKKFISFLWFVVVPLPSHSGYSNGCRTTLIRYHQIGLTSLDINLGTLGLIRIGSYLTPYLPGRNKAFRFLFIDRQGPPWPGHGVTPSVFAGPERHYSYSSRWMVWKEQRHGQRSRESRFIQSRTLSSSAASFGAYLAWNFGHSFEIRRALTHRFGTAVQWILM